MADTTETVQVVMSPPLVEAFDRWLADRGLARFPMPVEDDLPTFGVWMPHLPGAEPQAEPNPCGHAATVKGCGGCDPGAVEYVKDDGDPTWRRIERTCCGTCPGGTCYVDAVTGA